MTFSLASLNSMSTPVKLAFEPYDYIIEGQDNACSIDTEQMIVLRAIMSRVPSMHLDDHDGAGDARTRWVSRTELGAYLFVEICAHESDESRYFVTSFVDDLEYLKGYVEIED